MPYTSMQQSTSQGKCMKTGNKNNLVTLLNLLKNNLHSDKRLFQVLLSA